MENVLPAMLKTTTAVKYSVKSDVYEVIVEKSGASINVSVKYEADEMPVWSIERMRELRDALNNAIEWNDAPKTK